MQELAAPQGAVEAVAEAVEGDADRRPLDCRSPPGTPRYARGDAGRRPARRPAARGRTWSTGTPGGGRRRRPPASTSKSRRKCAMPVGEGAAGSGNSPDRRCGARGTRTVLGQAEGVLQLGAARQDRARRTLPRQRQRLRRAAARAADRHLATAEHPRDRVVGAGVDRPVVAEEVVGDAAQAAERIAVGVGDRLVGDVAAGQHERLGETNGRAGDAAAYTGA